MKVHAVGLNPIDYKLTDWGYATWNYPQIIGLDIAGVIEQVGKEISTFKVGDSSLWLFKSSPSRWFC
ncbi:alcohol dehydrogenase catalytic domain-containing protein [Photobacterium damselae subsp. piscicida]|nr:alcohol dehydrogenase catalytic domain-containing protein [Photobacterium damselae subsp. piscicida]